MGGESTKTVNKNVIMKPANLCAETVFLCDTHVSGLIQRSIEHRTPGVGLLRRSEGLP